MDKPLSIIIEETKKNIAATANSSGLPIWIINQIMQDFARQTQALADETYLKDMDAYMKSKEEDKVDGD